MMSCRSGVWPAERGSTPRPERWRDGYRLAARDPAARAEIETGHLARGEVRHGEAGVVSSEQRASVIADREHLLHALVGEDLERE
jgi:hypothetical protein